MKIKLVLSLVLALLVFTFITQNAEMASVTFLAWSIEISIVLLVFIILGAGIVIGWSLNSYFRFVRNRKRAKILDNEVMSQPMQDVAARGDKDKHE